MIDTLSAQQQWKGLIIVRDNIVSFADCCWQCPGTWVPLESGGDHQCNLHVPLVQTQLLLVLLLQWTTLFVAQCNHVNIASRNDNTKVFDRHICCNVSCRQTSFIAGAMALLRWWRVTIGVVNFTPGALAPSRLSKVLAQSPIVARGLSLPCAWRTWQIALVTRGSSLPCTTYATNCPCGKGLILGKGFVITFFGERLVVASLMDASSLAYLPYCPWQCTCCLWHTQCTCLWQHTRLWQCTCHLQHTPHTQVWHICAAGHSVAQYGRRCILQTTTYNIWLLRGRLYSFFPRICLLLSVLLEMWQSKMIVASSPLLLWHCNQYYCWRFTPLQSSMWFTSMRKVGCCCAILHAHCNQLLLLLPAIWCKHFDCCILCNTDSLPWSLQSTACKQIDSCVVIIPLQLLVSRGVQNIAVILWSLAIWHKKYACCCHPCNQQDIYFLLLCPCVLQWFCYVTCSLAIQLLLATSGIKLLLLLLGYNMKNMIVICSLAIL